MGFKSMASNSIRSGFKRSALTVALGLCFAGAVQAQSTSGNVYGTTTAGATVTVSNDAGFTRTVTADSQGRFNIGSLPVGNYTVTSGANKRSVVVTPGQGAGVQFVAEQAAGNSGNTLGTVTVTGNGASAIDVTTVSTSTVVTAAQLKRLPIARSAESIALLSPGAVTGNGTYFGNQIAFGGSSVAENAYYLNGFFSGNPMTNIGGFTLPYGSIEQQETFTGGYGAKYGRSAGGVISQIGKHGTNEWKFGGQVIFQPKQLTESRPNRNYPNMDFSGAKALPPNVYTYSDPTLVGKPYDSGKDRLSWGNVYSAYVGGPIVKDKLFFFVSAETEKDNRWVPGGNPDAGFSPTGSKYKSNDPKLYAKINWNINSNNLLEATYVAERYKETGDQYHFDWNSYSFGNVLNRATTTTNNTHFEVLKYTGYLTDNLTLSAVYGRSSNQYNTDPYLTGLPVTATTTSQNPALNGGHAIKNSQSDYRATQNTKDSTSGLRIELEWILGRHDLTLGMDNTKLQGDNEGTSQVADYWGYGKASTGNANISASLGVGPTGTGAGACNGTPNATASNCGYFVSKLRYFDTTSMHNTQNAYYLEDKWRITDNLLLSLGIRADKFQNFSDTGQKFVDSGVQWQPRLGFVWDVNGDSSFKVFGQAGRYFLNMPNAVAIRGVGASTYTREYFTYTGIDANGVPTGLTPVKGVGTSTPAGPVSSNGETGTPKDPLTYVPSDIKSEYQDEFVLGFEHALTQKWTVGAKLTHRELKQAIDDVCDPLTMMAQAGMTPVIQNVSTGSAKNGSLSQYVGTVGGKQYAISGCYMFNPNGSNTYAFGEVTGTPGGIYSRVPGSYYKSKIAATALGMPALKRSYNALDLFLEHRWDGKWEARIDYTFSKSHGNSEGPANSDTGQGANAHDNGVATSQNWDAWQIMAYSDGYLPNDRRHQLKAHAAYAITPEWLVSGSLRIASGAPISCFGYYDPKGDLDHNNDPAADPIGYYDSYHTCFGEPWTPGKKTSPWTHRLDLGLTWKPAALQHKLALNLNVFNVLNRRTPTSYYSASEDDAGYSVTNIYMLPQSYTTPRYVQLSASYDF